MIDFYETGAQTLTFKDLFEKEEDMQALCVLLDDFFEKEDIDFSLLNERGENILHLIAYTGNHDFFIYIAQNATYEEIVRKNKEGLSPIDILDFALRRENIGGLEGDWFTDVRVEVMGMIENKEQEK